jgi:hypothetical protein
MGTSRVRVRRVSENPIRTLTVGYTFGLTRIRRGLNLDRRASPPCSYPTRLKQTTSYQEERKRPW